MWRFDKVDIENEDMELRARKWSRFVVNEGQKLSEYWVSWKKGEKLIFDRVYFCMKTAVLKGAAMCTVSILHVDSDSDT